MQYLLLNNKARMCPVRRLGPPLVRELASFHNALGNHYNHPRQRITQIVIIERETNSLEPLFALKLPRNSPPQGT